MRKFSMILICILLFSLSAWASPFLVCDPYPSSGQLPTGFLITIDNGTPIATGVQTNADGSVQLHYDVSGLAAGAHTVTVQATNVWGSSAASAPFSFVKPSAALAIPLNFNISVK